MRKELHGGGVRARSPAFAAAFTLAMLLPVAAEATVFDFNASGDLAASFTVDVFAGDGNTHELAGYGPSGGFPGSDGRFVHFNSEPGPNSMQFIGGPVFLNSFEISSQYGVGGSGASDADSAGNTYVLQLFDAALTEIYNQTHLVATGGVWAPVVLNVANVSVIRIDSPGIWWPNVDNIIVNESVGNAPAPAPLALFAIGLIGIGLGRRFR